MVVNFKRTHLISWAPSSPPSASFFTPSLSCDMKGFAKSNEDFLSLWEFALSSTWYISHSMVTPPKTEVTVPDKTFPAPWWSQNHTRVKCDEIMIWTWATSFAISLFTFSPKIEPTASSPAIIVCKVKVKFLNFFWENQTCPGVAPLTTSIRPFAPEASPPTVKTTPATF